MPRSLFLKNTLQVKPKAKPKQDLGEHEDGVSQRSCVSAFGEVLLQTAILPLHSRLCGDVSRLDQDPMSRMPLWLLPENLARAMTPLSPAHPPETHTQEVAEQGVQHPQEQQQSPELPLHGLLALFKVPLLWDGRRGEKADPVRCQDT